uniref:Uncharacterized protein n=1 Tax=Coccidioides posadasii RMSCC 3488 TaxID=454284 RepID=A0A0J6F5Z6_COCPO|nr:hypothetical protein CPAG_01047 [Coccidioides posadasii RMSCC 3488]
MLPHHPIEILETFRIISQHFVPHVSICQMPFRTMSASHSQACYSSLTGEFATAENMQFSGVNLIQR